MANVESIEVLKGPAAILYGRVEPGGMVNVITKQPLSTPYYSLNQQFGSYSLYRTSIDATGPLTKNDALLYRMNFSYQNSGSFRDLVSNDKLFLAPVLKWNISDRTQVTLELEYNHNNVGNDLLAVPRLNGQFVDIPRSQNYGERSLSYTDNIFGGFNWSHQFNDDWTIKHRFSVNSNDNHGSLVQAAYLDLDPNNGAGLPVLNRSTLALNKALNTTYSTNIDLIGHFNTAMLQHTLLFGGDYYRRDWYVDESFGTEYSAINLINPVHTGIPPLGDPYIQTLSQNTDNYGLYLQDQIKLPYNIHVMGGLRYQYIRQAAGSSLVGPGYPLQDSSIPTQVNDAVTPRAGLLWQPQNWLSVYGNYTESFGPNYGRISATEFIGPTSAQHGKGASKQSSLTGGSGPLSLIMT